MARLHSPTNVFQRIATAPTSGDGTDYPLIAAAINTSAGMAKLDVFASMAARTTSWKISYVMSQSVSWVMGDADNNVYTFSGSASGDYVTGSATSITSEKEIASGYPTDQLIPAFIFPGRLSTGSWSGTRTSDVGSDTGSGHFLIGADAQWLASLARPIIVGDTAYLPFIGSIDFESTMDTGTLGAPYNAMGGFQCTTNAAAGPNVGSWAQKTPDWRAGSGMSSLGCALYGDDQITTYRPQRVFSSISCVVTAVPYDTLEYGYNPADKTVRSALNAIWNPDGTAVTSPLVIGPL